jgi:transcriptional regulator GlxA family with amidase domain
MENPWNETAFSYYRRLERLRRHVESHLGNRLALQDAADIVGLEPKYFSTFFRRSVGISYRHWLEALRVQRALELLASKNYSMSEVAGGAGFGTVRTLERAFRRHLLDTPRTFKPRHPSS